MQHESLKYWLIVTFADCTSHGIQSSNFYFKIKIEIPFPSGKDVQRELWKCSNAFVLFIKYKYFLKLL